MNKTVLLPADVYVVINKTLLNDHDFRILTMLYQPIVGSLAINLYFTLWSYLDKSEVLSYTWTHHHLMTNMQLNLSDIIIAREKLEAIGLIKTYFKEGNVNSYIYELYSPISASEFLDNPILATLLYSSIGKTEYQKIAEYFKMPKIKLDSYKNITTNFSDVFEVGQIVDIPSSFDKKKVQQLGITFTPNIDLDGVLALIPKELLNQRSITNDIKEIIYKIAFIYNFNEDLIGEIIKNAIDEKHTIDITQLKENARKYYQFEHGQRLPNIVYKNQPEYLRNPVGDTSSKAKIIYRFETTSPYNFLTSKNGDTRLTPNDVNILSFLMIDMNLMPGVVNVLIDYVLKINNNKLTKGFVEAIASQWKRSHIETVVDAMKIAEDEHKRKKSSTRQRTIKAEIKPDWFNKQIDADIASPQEQDSFKAHLKEME